MCTKVKTNAIYWDSKERTQSKTVFRNRGSSGMLQGFGSVQCQWFFGLLEMAINILLIGNANKPLQELVIFLIIFLAAGVPQFFFCQKDSSDNFVCNTGSEQSR
jgi:hypothetical protein